MIIYETILTNDTLSKTGEDVVEVIMFKVRYRTGGRARRARGHFRQQHTTAGGEQLAARRQPGSESRHRSRQPHNFASRQAARLPQRGRSHKTTRRRSGDRQSVGGSLRSGSRARLSEPHAAAVRVA